MRSHFVAEFSNLDRPLPFSLDVNIVSFDHLSIPYPCLVTHHLSLALRHDCQSSQTASDFGFASSVSEWLESERDLDSRLARATFVLQDYPPLPLEHSMDTVPQRSELLLQYKIVSGTGAALFESSIPLSKERRLERTGLARSKRRAGRGVASFSWLLTDDRREDAKVPDAPVEGTHSIQCRLDTRLRKAEEEWREEVLERELVSASQDA